MSWNLDPANESESVMSQGKHHRTLASPLRMLLVCAAQMFLVAGAGGQTRDAGGSPALGCPNNGHALPTQRWVRAMREKNISRIEKLLSTDVVFSDNGKTFRGWAEVNEVYRHAFAAFDSHLTMNPAAHVWDAAQRTCTETGTFEEDLRTRSDGTTKHYSGGYLFGFRLVGRKTWQISNQEWTAAAEMHPAQDH